MAEATARKSKGKSPAAQFYWADWLRDPALRSISSGARGLWIDILCLMWECTPKGHLQTRTGQPFSVEMICRMTGNISEEEVNRWLKELDNSGVSSLSASGVLISRRMVRDEHKRALCREAGKRGGNPTLKRDCKGVVKGAPKGPSKRKPTPSSSTSVEDVPLALRTEEFLRAWEEWKSHRREIKEPLTETQTKKQLRQFEEWGASRAVNAINHTILKGWTGLREPDTGIQGKSQPDLFAGQKEFLERRQRNAEPDFN